MFPLKEYEKHGGKRHASKTKCGQCGHKLKQNTRNALRLAGHFNKKMLAIDRAMCTRNAL